MLGKTKKPVTLAYRDKLLAEIAYYEKRISDALEKSNSNSLNTYEEVENSDDDGNPYTLNKEPSTREVKIIEKDIRNRVKMTLKLAMLTIMQSEVNVMVTDPEVRPPVVEEDGTWLDVTAECKIDLVAFTITFFAHKPYRRFAPVRYRNVEVVLTKAAHHKELAQSVLSKQKTPSLALEVLQSYASAFRSRRTTLLGLAERYADKLRMEALPEGGYRVRFLELLTVDWTLENMWSPVGPFSHRMKFELEYMPKEYIHDIGRLYKRFKDPSLETAERTRVLADIFDTCLQARGPASALQESVESDPDTAGRLHERRTTIDEEPEIPSNYVQMSPQKQPKGKENKAQNRKTAMEPPKTIPKKAKKAANNSRPNNEVSNDDSFVSKKSKPNDKDVTTDNQMEVLKKTRLNGKNVTGDTQMETLKSKPIEKDDVETRKGIKRGIESDAQTNTKKMKSDNDISGDSKSSREKTSGKRKNDGVISDANDIISNNNSPKNDKNVASAKNLNCRDDSDKRGELKSASATNKKNTENSKKTSNKIDKLESINKDDTQKCDTVESSKSAKDNVVVSEGKSKKPMKNHDDNVSKANTVTKNMQDKNHVNITNVVSQNVEKNAIKNANVNKRNSIVDKTTLDKVKKVQVESDDMVKNDAKKVGITKTASSKNIKVNNTNDPNGKPKKIKIDSNKVENKINNNKPSNTAKVTNNKATKIKEILNNASKKRIVDIPTKANNQISKENVKPTEKNKTTNLTFTKSSDIRTGENENIANPGNSKENTAKTADTKKETVAQKNENTKVGSDGNKKNNEKNEKVSATNVGKSKIGPKVVNSKANNKTDPKAKNPSRNEAVLKVTDKNQIIAKSTAAKVPTRMLSNLIMSKPETINTKALLFNKQNNAIERRVERKLAENQAKITEKLKSQIPMMKGKISTLTNKLGKVAAKALDAKTKTPQKLLPVFKKTVKNFPTRVSPRKLSSSFKPPSSGFSRK